MRIQWAGARMGGENPITYRSQAEAGAKKIIMHSGWMRRTKKKPNNGNENRVSG